MTASLCTGERHQATNYTSAEESTAYRQQVARANDIDLLNQASKRLAWEPNHHLASINTGATAMS